ncbi:MAG: hypothetical protein K0S28_559 [Paucimonas sp.]|nr:hypothetical protein [Paucimonas sp.]
MKTRVVAKPLPSSLIRHRQQRLLFWLALAALWLYGVKAFAATTYPPISSFLWGNTAVNAIGKTSKVAGNGWGYRYLPPKNFDSSRKYPVIIFLHGMGENARDNNYDNNAQLAAGGNTGNGALALVSLENQETYPLFFVAPQNASGFWPQGGPHLLAILNTLKTYYPGSIDEDRICLTGLSAGGFGTWDLPATTVKGVFSCLVPMSGGSSSIDSLQPDMPVWAFHAVDDTVVAVSGMENSVNTWRNSGRKIIYTRYDAGNHGIWRTAYQTPQLLPWMMAQRRGQPMTGPVDVRIKSVTQGSKLNLAVGTPSGLTTLRVGWSSNFTSGAQSGSDGVISGTTFTSASANFLSKPATAGRLAITYSKTVGTKTFTWKRYFDIADIPSSNTLVLTKAPPTADATQTFTVYRQGREENPMPGTGSSTNWNLNEIPLSTGFNLVHAYAELPVTSSYGGRTTLNEPYWIGYMGAGGDITAPTVTITSPTGGTASTSGTLDISGTAFDANGIAEVSWRSDRGFKGTLSGSSWSITNVPLVYGSNRITVQARDLAGNIGTATLNVDYSGISANQTPRVSAGTYQAVDWPGTTLSLSGTVSDDGLPAAIPLSVSWSKLSGPGSVSFGNTFALNSNATFALPGTYVLRLTASDSQLSASSDVVITVRPSGPLVAAYNAGSDAAYTAADGTFYAADTLGYGTKGAATATTVFTGTPDSALYRSWRYNNSGNVTYAIPVPNGTYDIVLKFSETTSSPRIPGMRVFDVAAEGQIAAAGVDILAQGGRLVAYDRVVRATVNDSVLNLNFNRVIGAPTISGIVVRGVQ